MHAPVLSSASLSKHTRSEVVVNLNYLVSSTVHGESENNVFHISVVIHETPYQVGLFKVCISNPIHYM